MAPEAVSAMVECLSMEGVFANPASFQHEMGERANSVVEVARAEIASLLNCKSEDLIFTSGATESNNLAIKGIALRYQKRVTI